jgi:hypothetical protein
MDWPAAALEARRSGLRGVRRALSARLSDMGQGRDLLKKWMIITCYYNNLLDDQNQEKEPER